LINWTLVRHGESTANAAGLLSGWQDVALTETGRNQAQKAGSSLTDRDWDIVLSSDLKRARQTAEIALKERAALLGQNTRVVQLDKRFRERSFGLLQGQSKQMLRARGTMALLRKWDWSEEGVESNRSLWIRLSEAMMARKEKRILLFAHGGVIRMMLRWHNRHIPEDGSKAIIDNASIHDIQFQIDEIDSNWVDPNYGKEGK